MKSIEITNLEKVLDSNNQTSKLTKALQVNPALATLLYQLLARLLEFIITWLMDDSGEKVSFWKATKAFFSGEFWDAVSKLLSEGKELARQLK